MKLGLINSAWLGTAIDCEQGIRLTKQIGFDSIDIFADPMAMTPQQARSIDETCRDVGLPVISVVCCALGIADFNQPVRRFHLERAKRFLEFAHMLGAQNIVLVMGEYIWNREVISPKDQWRWAVQGTQMLAYTAADLGLDLALELEPFPLSIVNNIEKMERFLAEADMPGIKANVDISHLALAHDPAESISRLAGRIAHVHISDCDGIKHGDLPPGRGVVSFQPYLKALQNADFDGTVSLELEYSPEPGKIIEWVGEAYQTTDQMMSRLGLRA